MPGIFGLVSEGGIAANQSSLDHMARTIHHDRFQQVRAVDDSTAFGVVGLAEASPQVASDAGVRLAFYGLIVDENFQKAMNHLGGAARALLERYRSGGRAALCGLNGIYTLALWESQPKRLTLIHDQAGYASLYYWHAPRGLWFAAEYKAIIQEPAFERIIDPTAIADLFLYQFPAGGRTPFQNIRALPPAGMLTYQDGRVQVETYGPPVLRQQAGNGSRAADPSALDQEHADGLVFYLRRAIRRRVRPGTGLLITGGLDSRVIAGLYQAVAPESELSTSTVGLAGGRDVVIGSRLSGALGLPHAHIPLGEDYLQRYAAPLTWQAESKTGSYASWILAQADGLREARLCYAMTGLFGNLVSGRHYPPELRKARSLGEAQEVVKQFFNPYLPGLREVMRPEVFATAATESAAFLTGAYAAAPVDNLLRRYDWLVLQARAAYAGNTADALGTVAVALEPFLDNEVLDYALNEIPPDVRGRALFYYHLIVRHLPLIATIPDGRSDVSIQTDLRIQQQPWLHWLDSTRRRALRRVLPSRYSGESRSSVPHAAAIRGGSRVFVQSVLARMDALSDLFDPAAVQTMLEDHLAGRRNAFMPLNSLLTTRLWFEQFCET